MSGENTYQEAQLQYWEKSLLSLPSTWRRTHRELCPSQYFIRLPSSGARCERNRLFANRYHFDVVLQTATIRHSLLNEIPGARVAIP